MVYLWPVHPHGCQKLQGDPPPVVAPSKDDEGVHFNRVIAQECDVVPDVIDEGLAP